jgi:alginate O-acetyltransferase complex protein AlgI
MLFNSLEYFVFLPVVALAFFAAPARMRVGLLLITSYYFYMAWKWQYGSLMLAVTVVNYLCGRLLGASDRAGVRRAWLMAGIVLSLVPLVFFKYFNFLNASLHDLCAGFGLNYGVPSLNVILPVGISFYTLQGLSYSVDVFRRRYPPEKDLARFALYIAFFPQLVAGPIERADHLLAQFQRENRFDVGRMALGLKLIVWGLFKKTVIADNLAVYVDGVYGAPELYSGSTLLLATYFFAFQIYCDFSGYSDIAVGSARILGYDLMQNFRLPYFATSIREFWQRWHISLSSWFADYVYIPLGGNRVPALRWALNIFVTFLISGLWHGAKWTFVIWGALYGSYYLIEVGLSRLTHGTARPTESSSVLVCWVKRIVVFHLVVLAWVFFRASTASDGLLILGKIFRGAGGGLYLGSSQLLTFIGVVLLAVLLTVQVLQEREIVLLHRGSSRVPRALRWIGYLAMLHGLALLGRSPHDFIYFQF